MNKLKDYAKFLFIFLKIGLFTIGGGLAMIPLMEKEFVDHNKFVTKEEFIDIVSLSQSVPGVISINVSVFIGRKIYGFLGSVIATIGLILPSFISIILILPLFSMIKDAPMSQKVLKGILTAAAALILLSVINLFKISVVNVKTGLICVASFSLIVFYNISAVTIILASGILGVIIYLIKRSAKNAH